MNAPRRKKLDGDPCEIWIPLDPRMRKKEEEALKKTKLFKVVSIDPLQTIETNAFIESYLAEQKGYWTNTIHIRRVAVNYYAASGGNIVWRKYRKTLKEALDDLCKQVSNCLVRRRELMLYINQPIKKQVNSKFRHERKRILGNSVNKGHWNGKPKTGEWLAAEFIRGTKLRVTDQVAFERNFSEEKRKELREKFAANREKNEKLLRRFRFRGVLARISELSKNGKTDMS